MKLNRCFMLAGPGGCLIATASTQADFTHLSIQLHRTTTPAQTQGLSRDAYRVYANFSSDADILTGVFGNAISPLTISLNGALAYNPGPGGNVPQNGEIFTRAPFIAWDSYATIGLVPGYVGPPGANLTLSPGFPTFITSAGIIANSNIAWETAGVLPQGSPVAGRVLIMQITVGAGHPSPSGSVGIHYLAEGTVWSHAFNQTFAIPATGALALLGLAGFVGRRRRDDRP